MLTPEIVAANKERYINLIYSITRDADLDGLVKKLENSDWFVAPASTKYHSCFEGGLVDHSLKVYDTLVGFLKVLYPGEEDEVRVTSNCPYTHDSVKIVALLHDFDKMNKYEKTVRNKKHYHENGKKSDEMGKFDWIALSSYQKKDIKEHRDMFVLGTHGENSVFMTETFVPLSPEEHSAILNHHALFDNPKLEVGTLYTRYPLACLLHLADMASAHCIEENE